MLIYCFAMIEKRANHVNYVNNNCDNKENSSKAGRTRLLSKFQEFVIVLIRLRLEASVSDIVRTCMDKILKFWICYSNEAPLPEKDVIRHYSSESFKKLFPDVVIIVDCTEIEMERPSALDNQLLCYSACKGRPTMKALLRITPIGELAFISELFPGSESDKEVAIKSNCLEHSQSWWCCDDK